MTVSETSDSSDGDARGRGARKSATAYRTISEVSEALDVPQHVLRFWETKFTQVRPLKRGGGRRYYRPEDIRLLQKIQKLLYEDGYTIKGVQRLLREGKVAEDRQTAVEEVADLFGVEGAEGAGRAIRREPGEPGGEDGDAAAEGAASVVVEGGAARATEEAGSLSPALRSELEGLLEELRALRDELTDDTDRADG
ncbi:MAG: MerR family transcriptional regulator [Azospirillaceae bacterium]